MVNTEIAFEQYCTYFEKNIILFETRLSDGSCEVRCSISECMNSEEGCKNKLTRLLTDK